MSVPLLMQLAAVGGSSVPLQYDTADPPTALATYAGVQIIFLPDGSLDYVNPDFPNPDRWTPSAYAGFRGSFAEIRLSNIVVSRTSSSLTFSFDGTDLPLGASGPTSWRSLSESKIIAGVAFGTQTGNCTFTIELRNVQTGQTLNRNGFLQIEAP